MLRIPHCRQRRLLRPNRKQLRDNVRTIPALEPRDRRRLLEPPARRSVLRQRRRVTAGRHNSISGVHRDTNLI